MPKDLPPLPGSALSINEQLEAAGFARVGSEYDALHPDYMLQLRDCGIDYSQVRDRLNAEVVGWRSEELGLGIIRLELTGYRRGDNGLLPQYNFRVVTDPKTVHDLTTARVICQEQLDKLIEAEFSEGAIEKHLVPMYAWQR